MNKNTFTQAFLEYVNGVYKGSMNRVCAFVIVLTICIIAILCVVLKRDIPEGFVAQSLALVVALIGASTTSKIADIRNDKPNPNLPNPNKA